MPTDIQKIQKNATGFEALRVDHWDATGRHWLTYFRQDDDGVWYPYTTADTAYNPRQEGFDRQGLPTAMAALEEMGVEVEDRLANEDEAITELDE